MSLPKELVPDGWTELGCVTNGERLVLFGTPLDATQIAGDHPLMHHCDAMGCPSWIHVIANLPITREMPPELWPEDWRKELRPPHGKGD